jgi:hypothetical protein
MVVQATGLASAGCSPDNRIGGCISVQLLKAVKVWSLRQVDDTCSYRPSV